MKITAIGLDLAKTVFHLVGLDEKGHSVMKKKISRKDLAATLQNIPLCTVAMEACGSASFWGRKFQGMGHTVVLLPPQYVKPFVRTHKNDWNSPAWTSPERTRWKSCPGTGRILGNPASPGTARPARPTRFPGRDKTPAAPSSLSFFPHHRLGHPRCVFKPRHATFLSRFLKSSRTIFPSWSPDSSELPD